MLDALQVKTESLSSISSRISVTVPKVLVEQKFEARLKKVAKTAKINGFRPGKVPLSRIRTDYGAGIQQEVIDELMRESIYQAFDQEKINAVGVPNVEKVDLTDAGLEYEATVEVYPTVNVNALSTLSIDRKTAEITDADVEKMIDGLRKQRQTFETKTGKTAKAADGDQVTFDFEGSIDGELFDGGASKDFKLVLGSNRMIPGFESGIVGMKVNEEKVIDVTFPEDYQAENLAGKTAQFKINVHAIESVVLPEVDEAFVKEFGVKGGVDTFTADVRKNMERELVHALRNQVKHAAFDQLLEANADIIVPKAMIDSEVEREREQMLNRFAQQFGGKQNIDKNMLPDSLFETSAERSVKLGVLVGKVIEDSKLEVDQAKVTAFIAELAESYEDAEEVVKFYSTDKQQRAQIEGVVLENQVVEYILAQATVIDVPSNYDEVKAEQAKQQGQF